MSDVQEQQAIEQVKTGAVHRWSHGTMPQNPAAGKWTDFFSAAQLRNMVQSVQFSENVLEDKCMDLGKL